MATKIILLLATIGAVVAGKKNIIALNIIAHFYFQRLISNQTISTFSNFPVPHKSLKRPNHDHIDYYDCSGKANGSYVHPSDCTRFIMCSNGNAADMACPDCNGHDPQCDGEAYLRWSETTGNCEWPADTECVAGDSDPCPGIVAGGSCGKNDCKHCGYNIFLRMTMISIIS